MQVRWTDPAVGDLTHICDYIEQHGSSAAARRVALSIYEGLNALAEFPRRGRQGVSRTLASWSSKVCRISLSIESVATPLKFSAFFTALRSGHENIYERDCWYNERSRVRTQRSQPIDQVFYRSQS